MTALIETLDEFDFHQRIPQTSGIVLVFFTGPHCGSCHHWRALLNQEQQRFAAHFGQFQVFEIQADKAAALVNEFAVFHLPSLFLYRDGKFHSPLQAEASPQKIIAAIEAALEKPAEEEP